MGLELDVYGFVVVGVDCLVLLIIFVLPRDLVWCCGLLLLTMGSRRGWGSILIADYQII